MEPEYLTRMLDYFDAKADTYDLVENQIYWNLSDALLWDCLKQYALDSRREGFRFLDAGGGTGRWAIRVLDEYPDVEGVLVDISESMLRQAQAKLVGSRSSRLRLLQGDLETLPDVLLADSFDVIWNFHNVLGFVTDPAAVLSALSTLLNPGGQLISFAPNALHAAYFNILVGRLPAAHSALKSGHTSFTDDMPEIHAFTPASLRRIYGMAGLEVELLTGFPCLIYPGQDETSAENTSQSIAMTLRNPSAFDAILAMEKMALAETDVAARGNNLFIVGRKGTIDERADNH